MSLEIAQERLDEMLTDLDRSIAALRREHPEAEHHTADAGANLSDSGRIEAALSAMYEQRAEVIAALERVHTGTYGKCVDCGLPVPEGRLEARPDASRCVGCQARYGRAHR